MSYLFVCGCARSGTTALARLLNADESIAIGIERFILYAMRSGGELVPALFTPERFFDVRPGDTHYASLEGHPHYTQLTPQRYRAACHRGDKIPPLYLHYEALVRNFPGARVVFVFRNVVDVAASFEQRKRDGTWAVQRDYRKAVEEWNTSLRQTLDWRERLGIFCIAYEDLFLRGRGVRALAAYAGADEAALLEHQRRNLKRTEQLEQARRGLTSLQTEEVLAAADLEAWRALREHSRRAIGAVERESDGA